MSRQPLDIGAFRMRSKCAVVGDPSASDLATVEPVEKGRWLALVTFIEDGPHANELETLTLLHIDHVERDLEWQFDDRTLETKQGYLGLFDQQAHVNFETSFDWQLIPHGACHKTETGAGFFDFSFAKHKDKIVGLEIFLNKLDEIAH